MARTAYSKAEIYRELNERIMFLELPPGTVITEEGLAAEFGVSRTPIREVLKELAGVRLVRIQPQNKTYVSYINVADIKEYVFFRRTMDIAILTDLAASGRKVSQQTEECILLQELAAKSGNYKSFLKYGEEFHKRLVNLAGHELLGRFMQEARDHINRYNALLYNNSGYMGDSFREHRQIVEYIDAGEPEKLEALLRRHHDIDLKHFEDVFNKHREYFE